MIFVATLAATPSFATHVTPPTQGGCYDTGHGQTLCVDPPVCQAPSTWNGSECVAPDPVLLPECRALVRYTVTKPAQARVEMPAAHCDRAGLELALVQILAKLLGAP